MLERRRMRRQAREAALEQFQSSSIQRRVPKAHVVSAPKPPPPRRTWSDRARDELEIAMELDLSPDREKRRKFVPSYERIADHLREKGMG